jgi:hypothetical protein
MHHLDASSFIIRVPKTPAFGAFGHKMLRRQLQLFAHRRSASRKTMEPWFIPEPLSLQEDTD